MKKNIKRTEKRKILFAGIHPKLNFNSFKDYLYKRLAVILIILLLPNLVLALITITDISGNPQSEFIIGETVLIYIDGMENYKVSIDNNGKIYYFTSSKENKEEQNEDINGIVPIPFIPKTLGKYTLYGRLKPDISSPNQNLLLEINASFIVLGINDSIDLDLNEITNLDNIPLPLEINNPNEKLIDGITIRNKKTISNKILANKIVVTDNLGKPIKLNIAEFSMENESDFEENSIQLKNSLKVSELTLKFDSPIKGNQKDTMLVKNIVFDELKDKELSIKIDSIKSVKSIQSKNNIPEKISDVKVVNSYSISLDSDFESATFITIAKGTELYGCENWDFSKQACLGELVKIKNIIPGVEYEVNFSNKNSAFFETGLATINTNKPIFYPNENVGLSVVVLDSKGMLVENADIVINITSPTGDIATLSTRNSEVYEFQKGIYFSQYEKTQSEGRYLLSVKAIGESPYGFVEYDIQSYFEVREFYEFDIIRTVPYSIDPFKSPFESRIKITSFIDCKGFDFTEVLPSNFTVFDSGGAEVLEDQDYKYLKWQGLTNNSEVSYVANSPLITPYLWELGPSFIEYKTIQDIQDTLDIQDIYGDQDIQEIQKNLFYEARPWILAVDPEYFYDPYITYQSGWNSGTGTTHTEVSDGIREPNLPDTDDYVSSGVRTNQNSRFGFPNITQTRTDNITLWVYAATGVNAQFTFNLYQGAVSRCSNTINVSSSGWFRCVWNNPSGDLSNLSVYLGSVSKIGGGKNTEATVYATYLTVDTGPNPPNVTLNYPTTNLVVNSTPIDFNFTVTDETFSNISNCTLYANFSGSWAKNVTIHNITNNTIRNITISPADGTYIWNINCTNSVGRSNSSITNNTVTVNVNSPLIENYSLNETTIRQNRSVRFNVSITDFFGISNAIATLRYPNGWSNNYTLSKNGDEYYFVFDNTTAVGTYNLTLIWANDTLGKNATLNPALSFEVQAIPPDAFNILLPGNNTTSSNLSPTLTWEETQTPDFLNYTILISKSPTFSFVDFVYGTYEIDNTTFEIPIPFDENQAYYWKVIGYDVFANSRNSTSFHSYITDTLPPSISLNSPRDNNYSKTLEVTFNYTPSETNTIDTCILYGNFSGIFEDNQTNSSISNSSPNLFTISLTEGVYIWNVWCNDTSANSGFAPSNYTLTVDISGPVIVPIWPEDDELITDTNIVDFTINASDVLASVDVCTLLVNDSFKQNVYDITDGVPFNFSIFLLNGNYNWKVNCTDTNGIESVTAYYNLSLESSDHDPPSITPNYPEPFEHIQSGSFYFNYTVEDATGIENCSLYIDGQYNITDYNVENLADNFFEATGLADGEHNWSVSCYDNSTDHNFRQGEVSYFSVDTINPMVILNTPENESFFNYSYVTFNYTPNDTNLLNCTLYANFSGSFEPISYNLTPQTGVPNYFYYNVPDGIFVWNVLCYDESKRSGFYEKNYTLSIDTTPPQYSDISSDPISSVTYNQMNFYEFNITWIDNLELSEVILEHNFSGFMQNQTITYHIGNIYSYNVTNLSAGTYYYRWYANDTIDNQNSTSPYEYLINKSQSLINLYFNGSEGNITINQTSQVNITAIITNPADGNIELYNQGELIDIGVGTIENISTFSYPGVYNITVVYNETQNYTSVQKTYFITVDDIFEPYVELISPKNESSVSAGLSVLQYNVSDDSLITSCSLYINGSFNQLDNDVSVNTTKGFTLTTTSGDYYWYVNCTDSYDNVGISKTNIFTAVENANMYVNLSLNQSLYVKGTLANITSNVRDFFDNPLVLNVTTSIIQGDTTIPWWNGSWAKRKVILLNETTGTNQNNAMAEVNITGLAGNISDCVNEIRIIYQNQSIISEIPVEIYSGDDSNWCYVAFKANLSASSINNDNYYVYYNNSLASDPNYDIGKYANAIFYAQASAQDEGSVVNVGNIVGYNDATSAVISETGGGGGYESAHGRAFINQTPGKQITKVEIRFRYDVTSIAGNWYLRYSINDGTSYSNAHLGTNTVVKTTSGYTDITSAYPTLSWSELNKTRLQGRVYKTGGSGGSTMNLYWVELNVTYVLSPIINQSAMGETHSLVAQNISQTNILGSSNWIYNTSTLNLGNYSVVSRATKSGFDPAGNYSILQIVSNELPKVNLMSPMNNFNTSNKTLLFSWNATDNLTATLLCQVYINGANWTGNISTQNNTQTNTTITDVPYGENTWKVICFNQYNLSNFSVERQFVILSHPDNFSIELMGNGSIFLNWSNVTLADSYELYFTTNYSSGFLGSPDITPIYALNYTDNNHESNAMKFYQVASIRGDAKAISNIHLGKYESALYTGFNLISIPFVLSNYTLKNQVNNGYYFRTDTDCVESLWKYEPSAGFKRTDWLSGYFVPAIGDEDFTSISNDSGYWLETDDNCIVTYFGMVPSNNLNISLSQGYNTVPWFSVEDAQLPTDYAPVLINTEPENSVKSINRFNAQNQSFEVTIHYIVSGSPWGWYPSWNNKDFTSLNPAKGYYFDSNEVSVWSHSP